MIGVERQYPKCHRVTESGRERQAEESGKRNCCCGTENPQSAVNWCLFEVPESTSVYFVKVLNKLPEPQSRRLWLLPSFPRSLLHWCRKPGKEEARPQLSCSHRQLCHFRKWYNRSRASTKNTIRRSCRCETTRNVVSTPLCRPSRRNVNCSGARWIRRLQAGGLSPRNSAGPTHLPLNKIGPHDDPKTFLDLLEKSAEACGWPRDHWTVRLISLLSGEVQVAAQQLPIQNLLVYTDLKRTILKRVSLSPEQHRQLFRSLDLGDSGRPFMLAQQLRDACRKWVLPGEVMSSRSSTEWCWNSSSAVSQGRWQSVSSATGRHR